jgi:sec-independent protein translocase protein TatC
MSPNPERAALAPAATEDLPRMSLLDHLEELRKRIFWALAGLVLAFIPCWYFVKELFTFLSGPLDTPAVREIFPDGLKLAFLGVTDPFLLYFKVSALAALFLASPFVLYQLWAFVSPGLYRKEKLYAIPFVLFSTFFFLAGGAFGYYVAFPGALQFLLGMSEQFQPVITIERYFGFLMTVILGLGLMFELPVVIFLLSALGLVTPGFLIRHFRWAVVLIFVAAAIITPTPDPVNMCIFAVPALLLYLLGVGAAALVQRGKRRAAEAAASETPA